jgi:hypothetical protein
LQVWTGGAVYWKDLQNKANQAYQQILSAKNLKELNVKLQVYDEALKQIEDYKSLIDPKIKRASLEEENYPAIELINSSFDAERTYIRAYQNYVNEYSPETKTQKLKKQALCVAYNELQLAQAERMHNNQQVSKIFAQNSYLLTEKNMQPNFNDWFHRQLQNFMDAAVSTDSTVREKQGVDKLSTLFDISEKLPVDLERQWILGAGNLFFINGQEISFESLDEKIRAYIINLNNSDKDKRISVSAIENEIKNISAELYTKLLEFEKTSVSSKSAIAASAILLYKISNDPNIRRIASHLPMQGCYSMLSSLTHNLFTLNGFSYLPMGTDFHAEFDIDNSKNSIKANIILTNNLRGSYPQDGSMLVQGEQAVPVIVKCDFEISVSDPNKPVVSSSALKLMVEEPKDQNSKLKLISNLAINDDSIPLDKIDWFSPYTKEIAKFLSLPIDKNIQHLECGTAAKWSALDFINEYLRKIKNNNLANNAGEIDKIKQYLVEAYQGGNVAKCANEIYAIAHDKLKTNLSTAERERYQALEKFALSAKLDIDNHQLKAKDPKGVVFVASVKDLYRTLSLLHESNSFKTLHENLKKFAITIGIKEADEIYEVYQNIIKDLQRQHAFGLEKIKRYQEFKLDIAKILINSDKYKLAIYSDLQKGIKADKISLTEALEVAAKAKNMQIVENLIKAALSTRKHEDAILKLIKNLSYPVLQKPGSDAIALSLLNSEAKENLHKEQKLQASQQAFNDTLRDNPALIKNLLNNKNLAKVLTNQHVIQLVQMLNGDVLPSGDENNRDKLVKEILNPGFRKRISNWINDTAYDKKFANDKQTLEKLFKLSPMATKQVLASKALFKPNYLNAFNADDIAELLNQADIELFDVLLNNAKFCNKLLNAADDSINEKSKKTREALKLLKEFNATKGKFISSDDIGKIDNETLLCLGKWATKNIAVADWIKSPAVLFVKTLNVLIAQNNDNLLKSFLKFAISSNIPLYSSSPGQKAIWTSLTTSTQTELCNLLLTNSCKIAYAAAIGSLQTSQNLTEKVEEFKTFIGKISFNQNINNIDKKQGYLLNESENTANRGPEKGADDDTNSLKVANSNNIGNSIGPSTMCK